MKKVLSVDILKLALGASLVATLSACGGGDDGKGEDSGGTVPSNPSASNPQASITGKVIDGYLVAAQVCLDLNNNGVCDADEPSATTDANGNFSIPYDGDAVGLPLLAQVNPSTRDLSRPQGFQFPADFSLSAVTSGATNQHVTPLTAMVLAQMEAGMSQAEAIAAVQHLLGTQIDPGADYIGNGDTATAAVAGTIVDKITSLAANGSVDAAAVRNTLNAIVAKGDVTSVTQADVDAQAAQPAYMPADASQVFASPVYSFVGHSVPSLASTTRGVFIDYIQGRQQIASGALQTTYQGRNDGDSAWRDLSVDQPDKQIEPLAQFALKADGTWSDMLSLAQLRTPQPLTHIGRTLQGTDPAVGIAFTYEERQVDLSGQPATLGIANTLFGPDTSVYSTPLPPSFPAGTSAYLGIQSYAADRVVLPMGMSNDPTGCAFPYTQNGACPADYAHLHLPGMADNGQPPYDPSQPHNDPALPKPLASVQQLVGLTLVEPVILGPSPSQVSGLGSASIEILAGGQARIHYQGWVGPATVDRVFNATWKIYERNSNVMVFETSPADTATLASYANDNGNNAWALGQGARFVLAVRGGQLHSGVLFPAGYAQRTVQFAKALPAIMTTK